MKNTNQVDKDLEYTLEFLYTSIEEWMELKNTHPMTERIFDRLMKADAKLNAAMKLAKEILGK